jgi:uncharacterized protein (DUF1499 family)
MKSVPQTRPSKPARAFATLGIAVALGGAVALALAGLGYRWGWWPLPGAFAVLRIGAYAAGGGGLAALLAAAWTRGHGARRLTVLALLAGLVGVAAASLPLLQLRTAKSVPPIHDITTDPADPPPFQAVLALRAGAANGVDYGGEAVAARQRAAYPDIAPIKLNLPPADAFTRALDAARAMGWKVVRADMAQGAIEATDRTFWFGFTDDIAVRVRADGADSIVDIRSLSRVGRSDVGANARRIRAFRDRLMEH